MCDRVIEGYGRWKRLFGFGIWNLREIYSVRIGKVKEGLGSGEF